MLLVSWKNSAIRGIAAHCQFYSNGIARTQREERKTLRTNYDDQTDRHWIKSGFRARSSQQTTAWCAIRGVTWQAPRTSRTYKLLSPVIKKQAITRLHARGN